MNLAEKIGEKIYRLRESKNISRAELAKYLNVTPRALGYWEGGKREIPLEKLMLVCKFFNLSLNKFVSEHNENINDKNLESRVENIEFYLQEIGKKLNMPGINIHQTNNHSSTGVIVKK